MPSSSALRRTSLRFFLLALLTLAGSETVARAALILNSARPVDRQLQVQVIQVANSNGSSPAPLFGSASAQTAIFNEIDQIWAQAGIDIQFKFRLTPYLDSFTLTGTAGANNPRSTNDLQTIVTNAKNKGGILDANAKVVNLFMLQIVPGFSQQDANTANGLAFVSGNGVTLWAGSALTTFAAGQEVIASVLAHELGHNLGLDHIVEAENLMQAGGSSNQGERLNMMQIATARSSTFLIAIPETGVTLSLLLGSGVILGLRRPRQLAA